MMPWMYQMMSQQHQVVKTTTRHSQKLHTASETVNQTDKSGSSHKGKNRQHNDGNVTSLGSLLGTPVKLSNGIADKNNNQAYINR